ncbi:MAG: c-type cytochrome [Acidobacteriota bacterium]
MRWRLGIAGVGALVALGLAPIASAAAAPAARPGAAPAKVSAVVERGKYLVMAGHCNDCHTPKKMGPQGPEPDPALLLSGHRADEKLPPPPAGLAPGGWVASTSSSFTAWAGPWGISYAANLTPDQDTGLGSWTEEIFVSTLRTGKHLGVGRDVLPPMPWPEVGHMTDADLKAIWAYLRSIPPIKNAVPEPQPPAAPAGAH